MATQAPGESGAAALQATTAIAPASYALMEATAHPEQAVVSHWTTATFGTPDTPPAADPEGSGPVSITLEEATIDTDYYGLLDLTISGLSLGQTVRLEKFKVTNTAGEIDASAILVDSVLLRDGAAANVGGIYNFNVLLDTSERDGVINAQLDFWTPTTASVAGHYVFRVSSPSDSFTATTAAFTITDATSDQRFVGRVTSNGSPVAGALVGLLEPMDTNRRLVRATTTDANGDYVLYAPYPDEYDVLAVKPGLVGPIARNTLAVLEPDAEIEQNFELVQGERTLSGTLRDATTGAALPGMEVLFLQADANNAFSYGQFTLAWTDENGAFSVQVPAGRWGMRVREDAAALRGYVSAYDGFLAVTDATSADQTDLVVPLEPATALIWGTLVSAAEEDEYGDPLPLDGIEMIAFDSTNGRYAWGVTDGDGDYRLAVTPGTWAVAPSSAALTFYSDHGGFVPQRVVVPAAGATIEYDPTARLEWGGVTGHVIDDQENPVGGLSLIARNLDAGHDERVVLSSYESDGYYGFYLPSGTWQIMPDPHQHEAHGRIFGGFPEVTITEGGASGFDLDPSTFPEVNIPEVTATHSIQLTLTDASSNPLAHAHVHAFATVDGQDLHVLGDTDANGQVTLGAVDGNWQIQVAATSLTRNGQRELPLLNVTVAGDDATVQQQTTAFTGGTPAITAIYEENQANIIEATGESGRYYLIEASRDMIQWTVVGLARAINGSIKVIDIHAWESETRANYRIRPY